MQKVFRFDPRVTWSQFIGDIGCYGPQDLFELGKNKPIRPITGVVPKKRCNKPVMDGMTNPFHNRTGKGKHVILRSQAHKFVVVVISIFKVQFQMIHPIILGWCLFLHAGLVNFLITILYFPRLEWYLMRYILEITAEDYITIFCTYCRRGWASSPDTYDLMPTGWTPRALPPLPPDANGT